MDVSYVLKHTPEDFAVEEVSVPVQDEDGGAHAYAVLRKCGMTTAEALQRVAEHWHLEPLQVTAAGLKDEDGITSQTISVRHHYTYPLRIEDGPDRWLTLGSPVAHARTPQTKGALIGNNFRMTVRRVDPGLTDAFRNAAQGRPFVNHYFINYFDRQRFGLPGSEHRTPDVGAALLDDQPDHAARILFEDTTTVLDRGQDLPRDYRRFHDALQAGTEPAHALDLIDPRSRAFFLSSHFSRQWNAEVSQQLPAADRILLHHDQAHPLHHCHGPATPDALTALPAVHPLTEALAPTRTRAQTLRTTRRPTVLAARFFLLDHGPDPLFPTHDHLALFLFLPPGCYASTALHQLLTHLRHTTSTPDTANKTDTAALTL